MHAAFRDGIRSPGGMACGIGIAGGVLLWLFWWIGRDSGIGVFGGLVSILDLSVTAFTGRIVWELRVRHIRHVMLRDYLERLTKDVTLIRQAMESKSWTTAQAGVWTDSWCAGTFRPSCSSRWRRRIVAEPPASPPVVG